MIKSLNGITSLKSETFKAIVKDIYFNHYLDWYKTFISNEECLEYEKHIEEQLKKVEHKIKEKDVIYLKELPASVCEHFFTKECYYRRNEISTAGFAPLKKSNHLNLLWIIGIPAVISVSIIFSFIIHAILSKYKISSTDIAPIFAAVSATLTGLLALVFSNKTKR